MADTRQLARTTPKELVLRRMQTMLAALPDNEAYRNRFKAAAMGVVSQPYMADCEPESVVKAIYTSARLNLIPDPVLQHCAIVPFRDHGVKKATFIAMYKGLVELAKRADPGLFIDIGTVYANDDYVLEEGLNPVFKITKRWWEKGKESPGEAKFSYCISQQEHSIRPLLVTISKQEGVKIAKASKAGYNQGSPWYEHEDRMREKTGIRRSHRLWRLDPDKPETRRFQEAIEIDERSDEGADVVDTTSDILGDLGQPASTDEVPEGERPIGEFVDTEKQPEQPQPRSRRAKPAAPTAEQPPEPSEKELVEAAKARLQMTFVAEILKARPDATPALTGDMVTRVKILAVAMGVDTDAALAWLNDPARTASDFVLARDKVKLVGKSAILGVLPQANPVPPPTDVAPPDAHDLAVVTAYMNKRQCDQAMAERAIGRLLQLRFNGMKLSEVTKEVADQIIPKINEGKINWTAYESDEV